MKKSFWFSMFMSWFFIRIIFVITWTWLIIFGRRVIRWFVRRFIIIIYVIYICVCFILLNILLNIFIPMLDKNIHWLYMVKQKDYWISELVLDKHPILLVVFIFILLCCLLSTLDRSVSGWSLVLNHPVLCKLSVRSSDWVSILL